MSNILTSHARSYGIIDTELDAFEAGVSRPQPHPQKPTAYQLTHSSELEKPKKFGCLELFLDDWSEPNNAKPIGISWARGGETGWIDGTDDALLAKAFISALERSLSGIPYLVMWNGRGIVFHSFLRHLARPLSDLGLTVQPLVTGVDIKAIILKGGGQQWVLCDLRVMAGLTHTEQEDACDSFGARDLAGRMNVQRLQSAVHNLQETLLRMVGVGLRPTLAAVSLRAMKAYIPEGSPWFRPRLGLESLCRFGGAYRGGYVYSEPFEGAAWRVDVNRMYTSLLRRPIPARSTFTHAGKEGYERPGIFLCRVEGEGYFPLYAAGYSVVTHRFHKQSTTRPSFWAFLPSAEIKALRSLGYHITAGLGFGFDGWLDLGAFAERLLHIGSLKGSSDIERSLAKSIGNSLTGRLGQSPERVDICYSSTGPVGGWVPFITSELEEIYGLWVRKHSDFKGGQHVDAAAWLTAQGRAMVYAQLSRVRRFGWRAVHVDTDGIILDQDPRGVLNLATDRPGEWRFDGYDGACVVAKGKWYSFREKVYTAGASGVTREQLEAVHYGKRIVVARKVLGNPFTGGPAYLHTHMTLGG